MRSLAPTSQQRGRGQGALRAMLAVLALTLATLAVGLAEPASFTGEHLRPTRAGARLGRGEATSCAHSERQPVCLHPRAFASMEWAAAVGASPGSHLPQQGFSPRGRAGFQPDPQAVHRAVRERLDALVSACGRVMRAPTISVSAGYPADRPPLVTRPLRGPPAGA